MAEIMEAFKLFTLRRDGTLGPLFINRKLRVPLGVWLEAESHPTKGYAHRPGWHATVKQEAPHLSLKGRVWCRVSVQLVQPLLRPVNQGGERLLAKRLRVDEVLDV